MIRAVLQDDISDCGVSCLLYIIRYYKGDISKSILREGTNTNKEGVSALELINYSKRLGMAARGVESNIDNISDNLPCIAHVNIKGLMHFVVVVKIDKEILIMDPSCGYKKISKYEFNSISTNTFLLFKPNRSLPIMRKRNIIVKEVNKFIRNNKSSLFIVFIFIVFSFLFNLFCSIHLKYMTNYIEKFGNTNNLFYINIFIISLYILKEVIVLIRDTLIIKIMFIFDKIVTSSLFSKILLLPYYYFKSRTSGEILNRIRDLSIVKDYITKVFMFLIIDIFSIILFLIFMFKISKLITWICLIYFIINIIFSIVTSRYRRDKYNKTKRVEDNINSNIVEEFSSINTIKGSHFEKRFIDNSVNLYEEFINTNYLYLFFINVVNYIKNNLSNLLYVFIYSIGIREVIVESISIVDLFLYNTFLSFVLSSFNRIFMLIDDYSMFYISMKRICDLYYLDSDDYSNSFYYLKYDLKEDINILDLNIQIDGRYIFNHAKCLIKYKDRVFIYGESGIGKSSLAHILMRYREVSYNSIKIGDIDINHYHLECIRRNSLYVSKEAIFNGSVIYNITMGVNYSKDEVDKVISLCKIKDPNKIIIDNGSNLSNGEGIRIIVARSIIKKCSLYIFDEVFDFLSISMERDIIMGIMDYLYNSTLIFISHRKSNLDLYNRILCIDGGNINEI